MAQPGQQAIEVEEGQVRPLALHGLAIARAVVLVERPRRGEVKHREFDDLDPVGDKLAQRITLPIMDVLHQQEVALRQLAFTEFMECIGERDEMEFCRVAAGQRRRAPERLIYEIGLAVADDHDLAAPRRRT